MHTLMLRDVTLFYTVDSNMTRCTHFRKLSISTIYMNLITKDMIPRLGEMWHSLARNLSF